jgi:predicted transcriptional regulator
LHLQYNAIMKTATIPPIRVAPAFRGEIESVLEQGESLSEFVENAVRQSVLKRQNQSEFVRRGMAAIEETQRLGNGIAADEVLAQLDTKLAAARMALAQRNK